MYHSLVQTSSRLARVETASFVLIVLLPSWLRRRSLALRRHARLRGAALPGLTLQRGLALQARLTLHILLPRLRILPALLLIGSARLVLLPALAGTRLCVLRRWSVSPHFSHCNLVLQRIIWF